ncbi:CRISPR-associated helicase Cas3' [Fibrella sp. WM1]|uniref:CRISPR-associated helicase Cas3' n=1 Tax=Fibrella musci TaxID=3242485 RepID=UPI00351FA4C8
MMELYAKSPEQGGLTLLQHTQHVLDAVLPMARHYRMNTRLARLGAILHDCGKAHPYFARMLQGQVSETERLQAHPHRHEISSLLFLPLFDKSDWPVLIEMVAAHHKSVEALGGGSQRGLIDLACDLYGLKPVFNRHADYVYGTQSVVWETWSEQVAPMLKTLGVRFRTISREEAYEAFSFAVAFCENRPNGWSKWRGLLMSADHFASEHMAEAKGLLADYYKLPNLSYYQRQSDLHPLSMLRADQRARHTFVVAPTGSGKTDYLLRRCRGRVVYTLPFQASINAMFLRIDRDLNMKNNTRLPKSEQTDVRRVHSASRVRLRDENKKLIEEEQFRQRNPGASVKIATPHQVASIVFGISGHEAAALDIAGCDVILDEVHVYDNQARAMMLKLVEALVQLRCRVHIGTATIPDSLASQLVQALGGAHRVCRITLGSRILTSFNRHIVNKLPDETAARRVVAEAVESNERILFIANRVARAQERYEWARATFPNVPVLLVHSRFRRCDRAELEAKITEFDQRHGPCIVIATAVVEVSLDISFDRMVTDAAPLDSLIQRFGRVNRRRTSATLGQYKPVHVIEPPTSKRDNQPYDADSVRRSFDLLPDGLLRETALQRLINAVYKDINVPSIDVHTQPIRELCHRPKSVLIDALEIDGACCIRESDRDTYLKARSDQRQQLEIPVPWTSLAPWVIKGNWKPLETGNYPYVINDAWYQYAPDDSNQLTVGLRFPSTTEAGGNTAGLPTPNRMF